MSQVRNGWANPFHHRFNTAAGETRHGHETGRMRHHTGLQRWSRGKKPQKPGPKGVVRFEAPPRFRDVPHQGFATIHPRQVRDSAYGGSVTPRTLAVPAQSDYTACIMKTQYTLRAVPSAIDRALRRRARQEAKSLNTVAVEALARGLELDAAPVEHTDLDVLIGSWQEDPAFDRAIADFERVDAEAWK